MGYYMLGPNCPDKAQHLVDHEGGERVSRAEAQSKVMHPDVAVVVVTNNGHFEAAGLCFSDKEFAAFTPRDDIRHKQFIVMPRERAEDMSGWTKAHEHVG